MSHATKSGPTPSGELQLRLFGEINRDKDQAGRRIILTAAQVELSDNAGRRRHQQVTDASGVAAFDGLDVGASYQVAVTFCDQSINVSSGLVGPARDVSGGGVRPSFDVVCDLSDKSQVQLQWSRQSDGGWELLRLPQELAYGRNVYFRVLCPPGFVPDAMAGTCRASLDARSRDVVRLDAEPSRIEGGAVLALLALCQSAGSGGAAHGVRHDRGGISQVISRPPSPSSWGRSRARSKAPSMSACAAPPRA